MRSRQRAPLFPIAKAEPMYANIYIYIYTSSKCKAFLGGSSSESNKISEQIPLISFNIHYKS